jgi:hypothetical protein
MIARIAGFTLLLSFACGGALPGRKSRKKGLRASGPAGLGGTRSRIDLWRLKVKRENARVELV